MQYAPALLALATAVVASPIDLGPGPACPILPASFDITNFHVGGVRGPVYTERYGFNVAGNVGSSTGTCGAANAQAGDNCGLALHDVDETPCGDSDFAFSFLESENDSFTLVVNYTQPICHTSLIGCRRFLRSDISCVNDKTFPSVTYEVLNAPTSFTLAAQTGPCIFN